MKKLIIFIFVLLLLSLTIPLYYFIIKPAYFSTLSGCRVITDVELNEAGYVVAGKVILNETLDNIIVIYQDTPFINKHELCHVNQNEQGQVYTCNQLFLRFVNELECYTKQYLPW